MGEYGEGEGNENEDQRTLDESPIFDVSESGEDQPPERKDRDESGRFVKGNSYGGKSPGKPRRTRRHIEPVLNAITNELDEKDIRALLRKAIQYAEEQESWKGIMQVLQFVAAYRVGKPVQRNLSAQMTPEMIRGLLSDAKGEGDSDSDEEAIDVE